MKIFSGRVKLHDLKTNSTLILVKEINILSSIFSIKQRFEGDLLSCLHQLFEIDESEIYDDYIQLRELINIDKKIVDRSDLVMDREGNILIQSSTNFKLI